MPKAVAFPNCCGGAIFVEFGKAVTVGNTDLTDDQIIEFLAKQEEFQRTKGGMAFASIVLNDAQMTHFGKLFVERGWKFTEGMYTPRHKTLLFIGYLPLQEQPKDHKSYDQRDKKDRYGIGGAYGFDTIEGSNWAYQYEPEQVITDRVQEG